MFDAASDLLLDEALDRPHDQRMNVRTQTLDKVLSSLCLELLLDLAEHELYWVELALVGQVKDVLNVQLIHLGLRLLRLMYCQVVHEEADFLISVSVLDHLQVLDELLDVDRLVEDSVLLHATLS